MTFDFTKIPRQKEPSFVFIPRYTTGTLKHFLEEQGITGWDVTHVGEIRGLYPDVEIPEVRLHPNLRPEKQVDCLVSYMRQDLVAAEVAKVYESPEAIEWRSEMDAKLTKAHQYQEARENDPSPLQKRRDERQTYGE